MFLGTILFTVVVMLVMPQTRLFIMTRLGNAGTFIDHWAPFSYILMLLLVAATFAAMYVMKTWPETEVPESPMAKYRREDPVDD
jgi:hypothetical protein